MVGVCDQLAVIDAKKWDRRQLCGMSSPTHRSESPKFQVLHSAPTCRDVPLWGSRGSGISEGSRRIRSVRGWGGRGWHCHDRHQSDQKVSNPPSELWFKGMPFSFAQLVSPTSWFRSVTLSKWNLNEVVAATCYGTSFAMMSAFHCFKTHQSAIVFLKSFVLSSCWFLFSGVWNCCT